MNALLKSVGIIGLCLLPAPQAFGQATGAKKPGLTGTRSAAKSAPSKAKAGLSSKANESVVTITARAEASVAGRTITLGQIADFAGGDRALIAQLSAVEVGVASLPGLARQIMPGDIIVHLRANHLESRRVVLVAPFPTRVTRLSHDVAAAEIVKTAIAAAQQTIKDLPNTTLEPLPNGAFSDRLALPTGKVTLLAGATRGLPEQGTLYVPVALLVDGKPVQTVEVALHVRRKSLVVITRRVIEPHTVLGPDDVQMLTVDLPAGFSGPVLSLEEAVGKRATRRLAAEAPVPASALETPPTLAANDKVTIEYVFGTIRITAPGLARQAGMVGDTIHVYATDTRTELDAVIVDARTVRIADGGSVTETGSAEGVSVDSGERE